MPADVLASYRARLALHMTNQQRLAHYNVLKQHTSRGELQQAAAFVHQHGGGGGSA